jgi:hypothetical protein
VLVGSHVASSTNFTLEYRCYLSAPTGVSATQNGTSVTISWNSVRTPATTSYTVYRSSTYNGNYEPIKSNISGTSTSDTSPLKGDNYYKVEAHGNYTQSDLSDYAYVNYTVGIGDVHTSQFQLFPNPAQTEIFIKSELQIEKVEIFDVMGSTVMRHAELVSASSQGIAGQARNDSVMVFNISNLPAGIYFIRIQTETGIITKKIIKM